MSIYSKPSNFWRFFFLILDTLKKSRFLGWGETVGKTYDDKEAQSI
jgi:hypothetical protein